MSKVLGALTVAAVVALASGAKAQSQMPCPANAPPGACSGEAQYPSLPTQAAQPQTEQNAAIVNQAGQPSYGGGPYDSLPSLSIRAK